MNKTYATLIKVEGRYYCLRLEDGTLKKVPFHAIHYSTIPAFWLDGAGRISIGIRIPVILLPDGRVFPDHAFLPPHGRPRLPFPESDLLERKASPHADMLARVISSFVNSGKEGWRLVVFADDYGYLTGMPATIRSNKEEWLVGLKNSLTQILGGEKIFVSQLNFSFEKESGYDYLVISGPGVWSRLLWVSGNRIYFRDGAQSPLLSGQQIVDFISSWLKSA